MKALFIKDWVTGKRIIIFSMVIITVCLGIGSVKKDISFHLVMIGTSIIPMELILRDSSDGWDKYRLSMPYKRSHIVSAKYLMVILLNIFIFAVIFGGYMATGSWIGAFDFEGILTQVTYIMLMGFLPPCFILPWAFGDKIKGKVSYIVALFALEVLCQIVGEYVGAFPNFTERTVKQLIFIWGSMAIFALSWLLSIFIYERHEL